MIHREAFEEWLAHPITEHVLKSHLPALALDRRDTWLQLSWGSGDADETHLKVLRECSQLLMQLSEMKFEDIDDGETQS